MQGRLCTGPEAATVELTSRLHCSLRRGPGGQCRRFEIPAPPAAKSCQGFQIDKRHWNHIVAGAILLFEVRLKGCRGVWTNFEKRALVLRFRSSHHLSAGSHANFRNIRSTSNFMILVRFMNLKFLRWTRRETGRNFKFTALVSSAGSVTSSAGLPISARSTGTHAPAAAAGTAGPGR